MTVSKRKIEEKIRMIVPKGTHIRKDVLDSIQQIIDLKLQHLIQEIMIEMTIRGKSVIDDELVWHTHGREHFKSSITFNGYFDKDENITWISDEDDSC